MFLGGRVKLGEGESFTIESTSDLWGKYAGDQDILWRVKVPESCDVLIVFEYFITETYMDYLFLGNGTKKSDSPVRIITIVFKIVRATIYTLNIYIYIYI